MEVCKPHSQRRMYGDQIMKQLHTIDQQVQALANFVSIFGFSLFMHKDKSWHIVKVVYSREGVALTSPQFKYVPIEQFVSLYNRGKDSRYCKALCGNTIQPNSYYGLLLELPRQPLTLNRKILREYTGSYKVHIYD